MQSTITYCYQRLLRQPVDSCRTTSDADNQLQAAEESLTLFSFYIADMPQATEPVMRICYADDITVWASGVKISELEQKVNTYLLEMSRFLRVNSLLI